MKNKKNTCFSADVKVLLKQAKGGNHVKKIFNLLDSSSLHEFSYKLHDNRKPL